MNWKEAITQLHGLHEVRRTMSYASVYHGPYVEQCVKLNSIIKKQTGRNYTSFSTKEIQEVIKNVGNTFSGSGSGT
jgi:hypothetical protein